MVNILKRIGLRGELRDLEEGMSELSDKEQAARAAEENIKVFSKQDRHHDDDRALERAQEDAESAASAQQAAEDRMREIRGDLGISTLEDKLHPYDVSGGDESTEQDVAA